MSRNSNTRMSHANPKRVSNHQVAAHSANKQKVAPAPPIVPPLSSRSPSPHNNNHNKITWPAGSIPRRVKKLSWDDESDSSHKNNKVDQCVLLWRQALFYLQLEEKFGNRPSLAIWRSMELAKSA